MSIGKEVRGSTSLFSTTKPTNGELYFLPVIHFVELKPQIKPQKFKIAYPKTFA
jgi:hypothetical protein